MPDIAPLSRAGAGAGADSFLHVMATRAGKVKGESTSSDHVDDIELTGWQWGLTASSAIGSTQAAGRRSYTALTVFKHIDAATTPLMAALATNDAIKEARLTMRKAGGGQTDFFKITLKGARITSVQHHADADGNTRESVTLAFTKVEVEYRPQTAAGSWGGAMTFTDELPQV